MSNLAADHELLVQAVREGGAIALRFFREGFEHWHKAPGDPVSEADHAVDAFLHERLLTARPDYGWLSEEQEDNAERLDCEHVWVVDPIDGTRAFIEKREQFTVVAALVRNGKPVSAAAFNPATDEFFEASLGGGARLNGEPIQVGGKADFEHAHLLGGPRMFERAGWDSPPTGIRFASINSIAYRMCLVACDRYDGCVSLNGKSDWDIAAPDLIVREAGGLVTDSHGAEFTYNKADTRHLSVITAGAPMHDRLMRFLETVERPPGVKW